MSSPEQYQRAVELFHEASALPVDQRSAFLERACGCDADLLQEVRSLLDYDTSDVTMSGIIEAGQGAELLAGELFDEQPDSERDEELQIPAQVGKFRIRRLIGHGGMGAVYEAEQENPRRRVALKMVRPGLGGPQLIKRIQREAHVLGRLQHPGIGQIYEAGFAELGGIRQPYFVMELIDGIPLDTFAKSRDLSVEARMELIAKTCDAVHYAHECGVVHRDLKPGNVCVVGEGAGEPKVVDFGVARLTDADVHMATLQTEVGQLVGTLSYMSPEQISGRSSTIDRRSDIYSLGVMLHEILAGEVPHDIRQQTIPEAVRMIRDDEPTRLGSIDSRYRGDIETIVSKALEKDPNRRYETAADLAADIRRYLHDEPIRARPASNLYQLRKFARRHKALVVSTVVTLLILLIGIAATTWLAVRESSARRIADRAAYRSSVAAAGAALREQDVLSARKHLEGAPKHLRSWEWRHLACRLDQSIAALAVADDPSIVLPFNSSLQCTNVWFHAAGDIVQTSSAFSERACRNHHFTAWDTETMERVASWEIVDGRWPCPSDDGARVFVCRPSGPPMEFSTEVEVLDSLTGDPLRRFDHAYLPTWSKLKAIPATMASASSWKHFADLLGLSDDERMPRCEFSADGAHAIVALNGALRYVSTSDPGETILDTGTLYDSQSLMAFRETPVWGISTDGRYVAEGGLDRTLRVFDMNDGGRPLWEVDAAHGVWINVVEISPDSRLIATGGDDRLLKIWDLQSGVLRQQFAGSQLGVMDIAFHPDGRRVATTDGIEVRLWAIDADVTWRQIDGLRHLVISRDGSLMVTVGREAILWDVETGLEICTIPAPFNGATAAAACFLDDDARLLVVHRDDVTGHRTAQVIDLDSATVTRSFRITDGDVDIRHWRYVPELNRIVTSGRDMQILSATTFEAIEFPDFEGTWLRYSPTGDFAITRLGQRIVLLDGATLQPVRELSTSTTVQWSWFAFTADGRYVAATLMDGSIELIDVESGEPVAALRGPLSQTTDVLSLPSADRLITCSADRTVRVWDLDTNTIVMEWHSEAPLARLYCTPDGETVFAVANGGLHRWGTRSTRDSWTAREQYESIAKMLEPIVDELVNVPSDATEQASQILHRASLSDRERQILRQRLLQSAFSSGQ